MSDAGAAANKRPRTDDSVEDEHRKGIIKNFWARSQSEIIELNFQWVVEHFSFLTQENGERLISPEFSSGADQQKWQISLFPKGISYITHTPSDG